ncbi:acetylcholine receptor subunit alpha-like [Daktulosphaira vitifoliae]|uniref:acetylcholine receptor subunit alpha-like n=1 Tax=Daktulosphaira vitifoliae TaxID=58002 RepID=UPI0021A997EC|nr:acetylcholine receptor subunit alpha-like [Daktulosphaira vitifoliae]
MKTLNDILILCIFFLNISGYLMNQDAKRLYDDLLSNYNKLVRPVINNSEPLAVKIKIKLSQLIDINLKHQIMTTNLWVEQNWYDYKLAWNPKEYGGVEGLHVPSENLWRPDIVLYNNADGNFEVTLATKAILHYTGKVVWKPPAIYKSSCEIDVEYFPFDEQTCVLKFGSWTYDGFQVDLRHVDEVNESRVVDVGVDLSEFCTSVEWDILEVPAIRNEKYYTCCDEPYLDITFNITMRRKTLFYTVNLIIPCLGISFLTIFVFYLPSDSNEKVTLSISVLLSLTVFFLLLAEIIPPTSLVVPLLGKFVLFTMILDTLSICVTVVVLNIHFRSPTTHVMSPWVRRVFIHILPRMLIMRRPHYQIERESLMGDSHRIMMKNCQKINSPDSMNSTDVFSVRDLESGIIRCCEIHGPIVDLPSPTESQLNIQQSKGKKKWQEFPGLHKAVGSASFIADYIRRDEEEKKIKEDWKYVAMVLDRLFLWIFTLAVTVGSAGIILQAPSLYDSRLPINVASLSPSMNQNYNNIM